MTDIAFDTPAVTPVYDNPEYFGVRNDPALDPAIEAAHDVIGTLERIRFSLVQMRQEKKVLGDRIKEAVAQETYFARMAKIANELLKGGDGDGVDDDEPPGILDD